MRIEKRLAPVSVALSLLLSTPAFTQSWEKFFSAEDQFIVNFPGEPERLEVDYITESGATVPARIYRVEDGQSRYSITVVDYTVAEQAHVDLCRRLEIELDRISPNQCIGRGHLRDIDGSIAYEAWNIRKRSDGEITYDAFGRVDGVAGHQLQILNADGSRSFVGLYLLDQRLYVLEGTVPGDAPPPGLFQQSLGMLDEEGRRVRLERGADGEYHRVQTLYEYVGDEDPITGEPAFELPDGDDGRIRAPGERMGQWVPEMARDDLVFLASTFDRESLLAIANSTRPSSADANRLRDALADFLQLNEFTWFQYQAGIIDETAFQTYLSAAADLFATERARTQWRNGLYAGDRAYMEYIETWLDALTPNR